MTSPARMDHGTVGRIKIDSEWNTDRDPSSRQIWISLVHNGKVVGTSSAALVEDLGMVDCDNRCPMDVDTNLTPKEMAFVTKISEEFEGRDH